MNNHSIKTDNNARENLLKIFYSALDSVNPYNCIKQTLDLRSNVLHITSNNREFIKYNLDSFNNIRIVGCGKAGSPMAAAVEDAIGERITEGIVTVKYGHLLKRKLSRIAITEASHPKPDKNSMVAAEKAISLLVNSDKNDFIIALLSGGGSALWALPEERISLEDIITLNRCLLSSGASIGEINTIRKQISRIKGGKAAIAAYPATVLVLEISDVIGNDPKIIASGPFSTNENTTVQALQVLEEYNITEKIPKNILNFLHNSLNNVSKKEIRRKSEDICTNVTHCICANNRKAVNAAVEEAEKIGYNVTRLNYPTYGEAKNAAKKFVGELKRIFTNEPEKKHCVVAGGETTVTLGEKFGIGGRNQEFALAAAFELDELFSHLPCSISLLSCGTDGTDGPTDAAGAIVDLTTLISINYNTDLNAKEALNNHNAYQFFDSINGLIKTGPTNTNVMDIQVALIENIM